MRQKRAKTYRKLMSSYSTFFGFRQPYQVLVDSEMCKFATGSSLDLAKHLGTVLQGTVKPMITQCCIHELYLQGKTQQPAVDLAKALERRKCNHREPIAGDECLKTVVGETNKHRYVVATKSHELRAHLRGVAGTPVIHVNRSVVILEPPSDATLKAKERAEDQSQNPEDRDLVLLPQRTEAATNVKKKGPKGPNPLSVKRKAADSNEAVNAGQKRKSMDITNDEQQASKPQNPRKKRRRHKGQSNSDVIPNESGL
ncbi:hypothetical protein CONPUDRAFT_133964 [Coniophora puteana RWD-64-598 SS2]|uniref:U three protein 23 n=1 Tax=Coniophora puteana (strain RWD-64-598) TaxID=741705 RepID=A0A5M3N5M3_CONPW|nr:uncharacterized protein CONPUDRAFT_133964 [Coniophora puteana RWD-64-598 SS2]EIW86557.1 hypothetical protein CONPUDRAFT_133964 [Coniophora puteana RWD-64-598 SS2]